MSSSQSQSSSSMSRNTSQANCLDPLDALIDFSEYEQVSYQSPSISPSTSSKPQFVRPVASTPTANNALLPSGQPTLSGPSHPYDLHKQQTGIPAGGLANTLAINSQQNFGGFGYMSGLTPSDDFDFNTPSQTSFGGVDMDLEFESPSTEPAFFYPEHQSGFINPNAIGGQENQVMTSAVLPTQSGNVGRLWPGMHQQQAALAKAQQQQKQQQQLIQQQRQNSVAQQPKQQQRSKAHHATDPIVEEKISQLLNSMRQSSVATSEGDDMGSSQSNALTQAQRARKDEEDMDEDERLLASEEGKKLSSKERRQLRNKVSARAFRSRRKEYISQLEGEIAAKVNENSDLRAQNRALMEENTRLSDLTRMLLSSPSFSGFLDTLTTNGAAPIPQPQAPVQAPVEQRSAENRQVRKDVNPYAAQQQMQNQQVNFAILPEQTMDLSMLDLNGDGSYVYQPQVFAVLEMPETAIDTTALTGKESNFVGESFKSDEEKIEIPTIKRIPAEEKKATVEVTPPVDEEFDSDPTFALFTNVSSVAPESPRDLDLASIFGTIEPEKALARFELVDEVADEAVASKAMARVQRICASLEAVTARLEAMTADL